MSVLYVEVSRFQEMIVSFTESLQIFVALWLWFGGCVWCVSLW